MKPRVEYYNLVIFKIFFGIENEWNEQARKRGKTELLDARGKNPPIHKGTLSHLSTPFSPSLSLPPPSTTCCRQLPPPAAARHRQRFLLRYEVNIFTKILKIILINLLTRTVPRSGFDFTDASEMELWRRQKRAINGGRFDFTDSSEGEWRKQSSDQRPGIKRAQQGFSEALDQMEEIKTCGKPDSLTKPVKQRRFDLLLVTIAKA
ncbi:hypothetical protein LXL04_030064 [Taraxacum kok-saghyz]